MTIWWVDPYIGTTAGSANGTTDTVTRNGSYAAPFRLSDITNTAAAAPAYNGQTLAAGDEIRLKGLTNAQWRAHTFTENWYRTAVGATNIRSVNKSSAPPAAYLSATPTKRPVVWFDTVPGFGAGGGPMIACPQYLYDQTSYWDISTSSTWWQGYGYGVVGSVPINPGVYLLNADYFQPVSSGYTYWFYNAPQITVTSGWDSETTRAGKTLIVWQNNGGRYTYLGQHGTTMARVDYDCPELYFIATSNTSYDSYWYFYAGTNATFKIGGVSWNYSSSQPNLYVSPGSTVEINSLCSPGYGWSVNAWSSVPTGATVTLKNSMCSYSTAHNLALSGAVTVKIGSVYSYQNSQIITGMSSLSGATLELLAGSVYSLPTNNGTMFANATYLGAPYLATYTIGAGITNTFAGQQYSTTIPQPAARATLTLATLDSVTASGSMAITGGFAQVDAVSFTPYFLDNVNRASVLPAMTDYRASDLTIPNMTVASGKTHRAIVFASNTFDATPLALIFSNAGRPALLYNEAAKANALTFQGATLSANELFYKQIALDLPSYSAQTAIRLSVQYETSADFSGELQLTPLGVNGTTGGQVLTQIEGGSGLKLFAGAQVATTTWTVDIPVAWFSGNAITQMLAELRFKSGANIGKFHIRAITLTQVP